MRHLRPPLAMATGLTTLGLLIQCTFGLAQTVIPQPDPPPWNAENTVTPGFVSCNGIQNAVHGVVQYRCGSDNVLDRPLLLIEGLDLGQGWSSQNQGYGNITWNHIHGGHPAEFPQGADFRPALDSLHFWGVDVFLLDFAEGQGSTLDKVELTKHVLNLIAQSNAADHAIALVGVSMGGVVGKMALAQLESEGILHCTGMFFSIDAPFLGATLPIGLQALLQGLSNTSASALAQWHSLNSPAAMELLRHHIINPSVHPWFQEQQVNWPQVTRNFNIINSHPSGHPLLDWSPLIDIQWGWTESIGSPFHLQAKRWQPNLAGGIHSMAEFCLPGDLDPFTDLGLINSACINAWVPTDDLCNVPGSRSPHVTSMANAIASAVPLPLHRFELQSDFTFIPFHSAMGGFELTDSESPWESISTAPAWAPRELHASLASHHRQWFLSKIMSMWGNHPHELPTEEGIPTWTLGWQQPNYNQLGSVTLNDEATMHIGNLSEPFVVSTQPCHTTIHLKSGSTLFVGNSQSQSQGVLYLTPGTTLLIDEGATVVVGNGSKLHMSQDSQMLLDGGMLIVESGGTFENDPGSNIVWSSSSSECHLEGGSTCSLAGSLNLVSGSTGTIHNQGNMMWKDGTHCWIGELAELTIEQHANGCSAFQGCASTNGPGWLNVNEGEWTFSDEANLLVNCNLRIQEVELQGESNAFNQLTTRKQVRALHNQLGLLRWLHSPEEFIAQSFRFGHNHVDDCTIVLESSSANIWNNQFGHSHLETRLNHSPFVIQENQWAQPWFDDTPALSIKDGNDLTHCEGNTWHGGYATQVKHASVAFKCNEWEDCTTACSLEGTGAHCFSNACGGGHNIWNLNDTHFRIHCAESPLLNHGSNHFGMAVNQFAQGQIQSASEAWEIFGNSWDVSMITSPWQSPIASNLLSCDQPFQDIQTWMVDFSPFEGCPSTSKPLKAKRMHQTDATYNVLGQELPLHSEEGNQVLRIPSKAEQ